MHVVLNVLKTNLPNYNLLMQSKSTVIDIFLFFSYLTPRINNY